MEMPLSEIIDRMSIVKLKIERIGEPYLNKEFENLRNAIEEFKGKNKFPEEQFKNWFDNLYNINEKIWNLEFDIRRGKEGLLGLEEVGRRAIAIRDLNKKRVSIKNEIIERIGSGFKDIKINHASE